MKNAQTFSTDALVAVTIFILAAVMLYYIAVPGANSGASKKVQDDAIRLPAQLSAQLNLSAIFIRGTKIDNDRLSAALNLSYESLKDLFGIDSDFCIYLEDDKGNIVPMQGKVGVGSPLVNFSGKACNATIS